MIEDKTYCMSSFLMYRTVINPNKCFSIKHPPYHIFPNSKRYKIHNSQELYESLKRDITIVSKEKTVALALSGGIDSAILARLLPEGTMTYTFRCVSSDIERCDETAAASKYAERCGLRNKVVDITCEDLEDLSVPLMLHKGAPIHSIEIQIYKAALQAKKDGVDTLIFGESADVLYGGMSNLLSRDWTLDEFIHRYSYVLPCHALKEYQMILDPYIMCTKNGFVDVHQFNSSVFYEESINSYYNACATAGIGCLMPYSNTILSTPLDYNRIRSGESKYLIRELFSKLYNDFDIPPKKPMPRPMDEWLKNWAGPTRLEFLPNCTNSMTGDQKWLIWILERFLNLCV